MSDFRSGFVALVGKPNVGKSTFVNHIMGQRITIVSPKPQTTRRRILGILSTPSSQAVFVDTPGFGKARDALGRRMLSFAKGGIRDADVLILMAEAGSPPGDEDLALLNFARARIREVPAILLLNKVDRLKDKSLLLPVMDAWHREAPFRELIPVSALTGENVDRVLNIVTELLPPGPPLFPLDQKTEQDERSWAGEIIREKVLYATRDEVPHSVAVQVEEMREGKTPGVRYIEAILYVEKESQKKILVGKGGEMLKRIGEHARKDLEKWLGEKVFLSLWVKVKPGWREREEVLRWLG
ncbi:MAG: GTPase Era [Armatimonadetes bacterium]|nr:GTPase Era [Armatimonadota bacterium]